MGHFRVMPAEDAGAGVSDVNVTHISDSAVATGTAQLGVNVVQISADSTAADNCEAFFDGTGYNATANSMNITQIEGVDATTAIEDTVWDAVLTGASHNDPSSAGRRLRQVDAAFIVTEGTAQAGAAGSITLASGESSTDDIFRGDRVQIISGTGAGEHGLITTYNGTTKVATMSENWVVTPDNTSEYILVPADCDVETWQHIAVTNSSTTNLPEVDAKSLSDNATAADNLEASALGIITGSTSGTPTTTATDTDLTGYADDDLIGRTIVFTGGTANGQASDITDYANTNGVVTYTAIQTAPAASDSFVIV